MRSRVLSTLILTTLTILFLSGTAYSYRIGKADVKVHGSITEKYDSNITYANTDAKQDAITIFKAGVSARYEWKRGVFDILAEAAQDVFAYHPKYNSTDEDLLVNFMFELSKYERILFTDTLTHTYEPRSFEQQFGYLGGRYSYIRNRLNASYIRDIMKQLTLTIRYSNAIDAPSTSAISRSYLNSVGGELVYNLSSTSMIFGAYDFSVRSFDPGADAFTQRAEAGLRQHFTKQIYAEGSGGVDILKSYTDVNYIRPFVFASLIDEMDANTRASLFYRQEYYTIPYAQDLFNYWEIAGQFAKQFMKRLNGSFYGFYGNGEYIASGTTDNLFGANAGLNYDITDRFRLNASYRYSSTNSNVAAREYNKNVVSLGIRGDF